MNLRHWLQSSNSSESSESLQDLSLSASCSAPTTFAASRPMSTRKSANAYHFRINDQKQVRLRAHPASMFGAKKRCFNAAWYHKWDCLEYFVKFDAVFCFPCRNFESKLEEAFEECVVNCESTFTIDGYRY